MKKLLEKFLQLSRGKQIGLVVCCLHLLAIAALWTHHFSTVRWRPSKPMVVRTIVPVVPPKSKAPIATPIATKSPPKAAAKPIAEAPKSQAKKPAPQPTSKPVVENKKGTAKATVSSAPAPKSAPKPQLTLPQRIEPVADTVTETPEEEMNYAEKVAAYIQQALELPEYGDVKVRIEINSNGLVTRCDVLEAKSSKNSEFLKKELPELQFPCLNGVHGARSKTFTITFRNLETH